LFTVFITSLEIKIPCGTINAGKDGIDFSSNGGIFAVVVVPSFDNIKLLRIWFQMHVGYNCSL